MAIHRNLKDFRFDQDEGDIRGSDIHGADDEKLGTVVDVIFDTGSGDLRYLVVDTGGWMETELFLVPAREVMNNVEGEDHFRVNAAREQIRQLPPFNESALD